MKKKDQILLEEAYQKIYEDFTGASDPNMLKPSEVSANQKETEMRQDKTFTLNNIVAAFKQQGKTTVTPLEGNMLPKELRNVFVGKGGTAAKRTAGKTTGGEGFAPDFSKSKVFLIQKDLGLVKKAIRAVSTGSSIKISKALLQVENDSATLYMINDVNNKVVFTRSIYDTQSLYKAVDEFNKD
jgi:hypothetical protein